jgi:phenylacetate-CoA ligase
MLGIIGEEERLPRESPYWNPKTETLGREQLESLQLAKLRRQCAWAAARSPWYQRSFSQAGFEPDQLRTLADMSRIPCLTRDEWMASQDERPPYGEVPTIGGDGAIRVHTTSGTTGRGPLRALDSRKDWAWIAEMWCYGLWGCGVRTTDTAYIAFGYGSFIGFWGLHYAMEKMGVLNVPGGAQPTDARVNQIFDFGATVVASTPTYALRLAQEARERGRDLRASGVERLILSGEPAGSIPQTKALIEEQWGAKAYDTAGMTEIGTIMVFECSHQPGGTHIIEDNVIEEVVDPETLEPVAYGERGERVVTSFGRGSIPLIRYRTGDMVCKVPASVCQCGRGFDIYEGGILGRVDDMKIVRGTNVYPRAIEAIVREFPGVDEFQTVITHEGIRDEITLRVEMKRDWPTDGWDSLCADLHRRLSQAHEGLNFRVVQAGAGELPRFELKAKRTIDQRAAPIGVR